ncbi:MAG: biosynthetic-type acetolactate synthase large subunit [Eubacteriales bacterium]
MNKEKITATKAIFECLLEQDVDTIFGYPGGSILNLYDELYRYQDKITHVLTAHEQGASHAADGYARATGKVGVCFATSGPGMTNLTTGIATAYMDSSPVVFITCNVGENLLGKDSFQEVDSTGIAMPITKATYLVRDPNLLVDSIRQAFAVAASGRPGPVLVDILKTVTLPSVLVDYEFIPWQENRSCHSIQAYNHSHGLKAPEPNKEDVAKLASMIQEAEKVMVISGGGVVRSRAKKEITALAEWLQCPTATTVMGAGGFSGKHPLFTGMVGMHGSEASNFAVVECDLLLVVGGRFSDRVALNPATFAKQAKIVQIDIDRAEIDKNVVTDHHIIGSARKVLAALLAVLPKEGKAQSDWTKNILAKRRPTPFEPQTKGITPQQVLEIVAHTAPEETVVATDVGQHQMWSIQHFRFTYEGQLLTSGGFGTMGFGLGAAIGAKIGCPEKVVVHTTGDGCFRMNCHELSTVEYYKLPIITIIFNNGALGMVRQWQNLIYDKRFSSTDLMERSPDFVKLAEAYGVNGVRVTTAEEMQQALEKALASDKATVIDVVIHEDAMVRPMVAAGSEITAFLLGEETDYG